MSDLKISLNKGIADGYETFLAELNETVEQAVINADDWSSFRQNLNILLNRRAIDESEIEIMDVFKTMYLGIRSTKLNKWTGVDYAMAMTIAKKMTIKKPIYVLDGLLDCFPDINWRIRTNKTLSKKLIPDIDEELRKIYPFAHFYRGSFKHIIPYIESPTMKSLCYLGYFAFIQYYISNRSRGTDIGINRDVVLKNALREMDWVSGITPQLTIENLKMMATKNDVVVDEMISNHALAGIVHWKGDDMKTNLAGIYDGDVIPPSNDLVAMKAFADNRDKKLETPEEVELPAKKEAETVKPKGRPAPGGTTTSKGTKK